MILYSITRGPRGYMMAKFDDDFNVAAVYSVNQRSCSCPAGPRPTCRHRKMLPRMLSKVDTDEFYCYETQTWHQPLGDLLRPEAGDLPGREALPDVGKAKEVIHKSDCALHNMPAYPNGPCDCGALEGEALGSPVADASEASEGEIEAGIIANMDLTRDQVIDKLEAAMASKAPVIIEEPRLQQVVLPIRRR